MLMCNNHLSGAITISIITIFLISAIILVIATSSFFTNDKINKYTIEKIDTASVECMYEDKIYKEVVKEEITEMNNDNTDLKRESSIDKSKVAKNVTQRSADIRNNTVSNKYDISNDDNVVPTQYKGLATIAKIEIPKTGLNMPILNNVTVKGMETGPCFLYSTGELNKSGSSLIVGHNYNNIFGKNKNLQIGDKIFVTTLDGNKVEYTVYNKIFVTPDDLNYMSTSNTQIAISTCTDDDNCRLVVLAKI